ncbi:MAG: hypothetical protein M1814_004096 [Vezdaea aestivalis]|nr:MAG: hypothetical protein M1814_004096 [Vezdaea aestivalis]
MQFSITTTLAAVLALTVTAMAAPLAMPQLDVLKGLPIIGGLLGGGGAGGS